MFLFFVEVVLGAHFFVIGVLVGLKGIVLECTESEKM